METTRILGNDLSEGEVKSEKKLDRENRQSTWLPVLGNIINLPIGIIEGLAWCFLGISWCCTIIGIPLGLQCFKMANLSFWPFGRTVILRTDNNVSLFLNIFWILFTGIWTSVLYLLAGIFLCLFIITIPWGLQRFKMAKLALLPFGAEIK